jgi:hypothetical protein
MVTPFRRASTQVNGLFQPEFIRVIRKIVRSFPASGKRSKPKVVESAPDGAFRSEFSVTNPSRSGLRWQSGQRRHRCDVIEQEQEQEQEQPKAVSPLRSATAVQKGHRFYDVSGRFDVSHQPG